MTTSFLGAGLAQAGLSNAGYGTPASVSESAQHLFKQSNGQRGNANFIDPTSGDYVLSDSGYPVGQDSIAQRVYLALLTVQNSASDPNVGLPAHMLTITPASLQSYQLAAINALNPMVQANQLIVDSLSVTQVENLNRVRFSVTWHKPNDPTTNLTSL